jgi:hypothetical protein
MLTSVRTMLWSGTPTPPTPTPAPTGSGQDRLPAGRDRRNAEMMVIAMWASGAITEEEMVALLAGL